jgi:hypothetical protein
MENRIRNLHVHNCRLDPGEAELGIRVEPEILTSTTQVRGRLVGPRCGYATTVEVAYPLREESRAYATEDVAHLSMRAVIPEANFWDPESPFLYSGPVELWQGERLCDSRVVRHGFRFVSLGVRGLRWNGRLIKINGLDCQGLQHSETNRLHQRGCNALVVPVREDTASTWTLADEAGFLLLGRLRDRNDVSRAFDLRNHACCLGWVLEAELLDDELVQAALPFPADGGQLIGMEVIKPLTGPLPNTIDFVCCHESLMLSFADSKLPRIIGKDGPFPELPVAEDTPGVLGWVYSAN